MGILTDSLFGALMSWVRALVSAIWAVFSSERTTVLEFLAKNWIGIAVLLIAAGLVIDWLIWLIRWQPYHIWAQRVRRILRIAPPEEDEPEIDEEEAARAAYAAFEDAYMPPEYAGDAEEDERLEQWMPLESPVVDEEEAQQVMNAAEQVPDEALGQYPGMRYDSRAAAQDTLSGTRRFGAVHQEGPGAAEVKSRRAEIDAWQRQMQEEARAKAEAERRAREEEARRAREEREAQAAYEQELREYELKRAQYERDMAEYERQMAEYEAALAAQQAQEEARVKADVQTEFAQENPQAPASQRRRRRAVTYSDMVEADTSYDLPEAPQWTQMQAAPVNAPQPQAEEAEKQMKRSILRSGMAKMAQMMEPESEDIAGIAALPPRVDRNAAYRPAKKPDGKKA